MALLVTSCTVSVDYQEILVSVKKGHMYPARGSLTYVTRFDRSL